MVRLNALAVALALLPAVVYAQGTLLINTPSSLVECQPAAITFSGGTAPYFISVLPGGQASATPLELLPDQTTAGTYTWLVNLPAGTTVTLGIRDSTGTQNFSGQVTILTGTSTACLGTTASVSGVTSSSESSAPASTSSTPSVTSAASTSSASSAPASSSSSRPTSAASSSSTSSAAPTSTTSSAGSSSPADTRYVLRGGVISVVAAVAGIAAFLL